MNVEGKRCELYLVGEEMSERAMDGRCYKVWIWVSI